MTVPPLRPGITGRFFKAYTKGLTAAEVERVFTSDAPEAYRLFSRHVDLEALRKLPWHRRVLAHARFFFLAFTLKLTPGRRAMYGVALLLAAVGMIELVNGVSLRRSSRIRCSHGGPSGCWRASCSSTCSSCSRSPTACR